MTKTKTSETRALHDPRLREIARAIADAGGRALVVGGSVRDHLLGLPSKDIDIEVYGLDPEGLARALSGFGEIMRVGRAFEVFLLKGLPFEIGLTSASDFETAARRRDLTMNSMGWDPIEEALLDPHGGRADLEARLLRETDPEHFGDDPLRGLRVAHFAARFELTVAPSLCALCSDLDLAGVPGERVLEEFRKLLLKSREPSQGLVFLRECGLLRFFPELGALVDVPQDPHWHPEGCVFTHTLRVVDAAAGLRTGDARDDALLMWAALCHDFGKPATTCERDGRIVAHGHEERGVAPTREWLQRLRAPGYLVEGVAALVRTHLRPVQLTAASNPAGAAAYRRLARDLAAVDVDLALLERVARADSLGRTTPEALRGEFPAGDRFLQRAAELDVDRKPVADVVRGRDLLARGLAAGPALGAVLRRCREIQDETGWHDANRIIDRALEEPAPGA